MPRLTKKQVADVIVALGVDPRVVTVDMLQHAMRIEFEHGKVDPRTNVTNDDLISTAKIALAHIKEGLRYYDLLEKLELQLAKTRKRCGRPHVFL